jgi:hypothetical protein
VAIKLRYRISRASNTTPQHAETFRSLNDEHVATIYRHELEAELSDASEPKLLSLDDKWNGWSKQSGKKQQKPSVTHENQLQKIGLTRSLKEFEERMGSQVELE